MLIQDYFCLLFCYSYTWSSISNIYARGSKTIVTAFCQVVGCFPILHVCSSSKVQPCHCFSHQSGYFYLLSYFSYLLLKLVPQHREHGYTCPVVGDHRLLVEVAAGKAVHNNPLSSLHVQIQGRFHLKRDFYNLLSPVKIFTGVHFAVHHPKYFSCCCYTALYRDKPLSVKL